VTRPTPIQTPCATCDALDRQDALQVTALEVVRTFHNPCAPVTQFTCKCRACGAEWFAVEVYDEDGVRPSEWSWERVVTPA
jgi:hypothetical protein